MSIGDCIVQFWEGVYLKEEEEEGRDGPRPKSHRQRTWRALLRLAAEAAVQARARHSNSLIGRMRMRFRMRCP